MEIDEKLLEQGSDFVNTSQGADIVNELKGAISSGSLSSVLDGFSEPREKEKPSDSAFGNIDISKLLPLVSAISRARKDNRATNLLNALKPLVSGERQEKIDKAISVMQILALVPILEEHGFSLKDLLK